MIGAKLTIYLLLGGYPGFPSCDFIKIISGGELCPCGCAKMHAIFKYHLDGIRNLDCNIITQYVAQYTKIQIKKGTIAQIIQMTVCLIETWSSSVVNT